VVLPVRHCLYVRAIILDHSKALPSHDVAANQGPSTVDVEGHRRPVVEHAVVSEHSGIDFPSANNDCHADCTVTAFHTSPIVVEEEIIVKSGLASVVQRSAFSTKPGVVEDCQRQLLIIVGTTPCVQPAHAWRLITHWMS